MLQEREQQEESGPNAERVAWLKLLKVKVLKMNEKRYREFESLVNTLASR